MGNRGEGFENVPDARLDRPPPVGISGETEIKRQAGQFDETSDPCCLRQKACRRSPKAFRPCENTFRGRYGRSWIAPTNGDDRNSGRSEEHTSELQSLMRISYAVFCLKNKIYILHI